MAYSASMSVGQKLHCNVQFGKRIACLRKAKHLSQEQLALASEINRTYMGAIERGEKSPSLNVIVRIAAALSMSLTELFNYA